MLSRRNFIEKSFGAGICLSTFGPALGKTKDSASDDGVKNILLYSGWQTINIGDIGHTPGTLRYLYQYYPNAKITVWLVWTNEEINQMLLNRFPGLNIVQGKLDKDGKSDSQELQQAFELADFFIYNSGMIFNQFWKPPVALIETVINRGLRFCLFGQSFDGFKAEDVSFMHGLLSNASMIYTRDTDSYYYLRKMGFSPGILEFGPDGCFGIDVRDDRKADMFLKENGLEKNKFVSVVIRTNTPKIGSKGELLSPKLPTTEEKEQTELWARKLREIITEFIEETKLKVLLVPEVDKEIPHAKTFIYDRLPARVQNNVVHRKTFWNVDEAASIYGKSLTVVAMEPHSCIIALANGTPAIHTFSAKHGIKAWMFRDIGLPEWLFDIDKEDSKLISKALLEIAKDNKRALSKVERAMDFVNTRSGEMVKDISSLLEK